MAIIANMLHFMLHIDIHLSEIIAHYGTLSYAVLFVIIFSETGFVLTPFLPGDSLLFAAGAFSAVGSFDIVLLLLVLWIAAFLGDTVNYLAGRCFGRTLIDNQKIPINQKHIERTRNFYKKHGGKTIFLARFVPIIRTFAPFIAGIAKMDYEKFFYYNCTGGLAWVFGFTLLGYFFGNIPIVNENFSIVIGAIIIISVLPLAVEFAKSRFGKVKISAD